MRQILTIAGSDSGGGAGIQADIKAIQANGGFALSVITSVTAQNTCEVRRSFDLPVDLIEAQIGAVFDDFEVAAVKTGMLSSPAIVRAVAAQLRSRRPARLVVDPVMVSKSGYPLLLPEAVAVLTAELLPLACLVTPNLPEAELLVGDRIADLEGARRAAAQIRGCGCGAVLLKGGHLDGDDAIDVLCDESGCIELASPRIETRHTHGTGCTYSAAIATRLGLGAPLRQAVGGAKEYITEAIRHAPAIGHGHGPVDHFYFLRRAP